MQGLMDRHSTLSASESSTRETRNDANAKLMETATKMMKNGATPDVITFIETTITEVNQNILGVIVDEHDRDQALIDSLLVRFQEAVDAMEVACAELEQQRLDITDMRMAHHECRQDEAVTCAYSRKCEEELLHLWGIVRMEETEMRRIHWGIHGEWCLGNAPEHPSLADPFHWTITEYKEGAETSESINAYPQVDLAWSNYNTKLLECAQLEEAWVTKVDNCDGQQDAVHEKACEHASHSRTQSSNFGHEYHMTTLAYNEAVTAIRQLEQDRKREWETLHITTLSAHGWAGCAPPKACIPCDMEELIIDEAYTASEPCKPHQEYLQPGQMDSDTFKCHSGDQCILASGRCNGASNCDDGSDELGCSTAWGLPALLHSDSTCQDPFVSDVQFRCADTTQCTPIEGRCNGVPNCADGSDEAGCGAGTTGLTIEATTGYTASIEVPSLHSEVFYDRQYRFDSLGSLAGYSFIKMSNDDKHIGHFKVQMKLRLPQPLTVYAVKLDDHELPWLHTDGWTLSGLEGVSYHGVRSTRHTDWSGELQEDFYGPGQAWEKTNFLLNFPPPSNPPNNPSPEEMETPLLPRPLPSRTSKKLLPLESSRDSMTDNHSLRSPER